MDLTELAQIAFAISAVVGLVGYIMCIANESMMDRYLNETPLGMAVSSLVDGCCVAMAVMVGAYAPAMVMAFLIVVGFAHRYRHEKQKNARVSDPESSEIW